MYRLFHGMFRGTNLGGITLITANNINNKKTTSISATNGCSPEVSF